MNTTEKTKSDQSDPTLDTIEVGSLHVLKQEVEKCMKFEGHASGASLKGDTLSALKQKEGQEGLDRVEQTLAKIGYPIEFENIRYSEWYLLGYSGAIFLTATHLFSWTPEDIEEVGEIATKSSFFRTVIFRLVSARTVYENGPKAWRKVYDIGELQGVEFNEDEHYFVIDIHHYRDHLVLEHYHKGYFRQIVAFGSGSDNATMEVVRSLHKGDTVYRYKFTW